MKKEVLVDDQVFKRLLALQRQDVRRGVCSMNEAMEALGIGQTELYRLKKDPTEPLKASKKHGKYIWSSVVAQFENLHGTPYKEAVV